MPLERRVRILFVTGGLLVAGFAVWGYMIVRRGFSARDEPSRTEAYVARKLRRMAAPADSRRLRNPVPKSDKVLAQARAHFADHCAICHGNDGKGNTAIGNNLFPKAPDMLRPETQSLSDGELFYTIKNGVRLSGMPAWGSATAEDDRQSWGLVHFIRHLPSITPLELAEMRALNQRAVKRSKTKRQSGDSSREASPLHTPRPSRATVIEGI